MGARCCAGIDVVTNIKIETGRVLSINFGYEKFFPLFYKKMAILDVALGCPSTLQTWISLLTCLTCSSGILNVLNNLATGPSRLALSHLNSQYE